MTRREFLGRLSGLLLPCPAIPLVHAHTREEAIVNDAAGLSQFLRDWRTGEARNIDPRLASLMHDVHVHFDRAIIVLSGYRSPSTNKLVGGAPRSLHMKGMALDFTMQGVPAHMVQAYLVGRRAGGVGHYKDFTHMDVGRPRRW